MNRLAGINGYIIGTAVAALVALGLWPTDVGAEGGQQRDTPRKVASQELSAAATQVIATYCVSCHGAETQKDDIRLDAFETIDAVDLQSLYGQIQDAVHFEEMPPAKSKQPTKEERQVLLRWLKDRMTGDEAKKLDEKLRRPESGNYVDHDDLFSGKYAEQPGFTYDRRWLISEFIFDAKLSAILNLNSGLTVDGVRKSVIGMNNRPVSLTNPFILPNKSGVRYYANETLNGGHVLTMMANAKRASSYLMLQVKRNKNYLPAAGEMIAAQLQYEKTLALRKEFLSKFIDRLLVDLYGQRNEALLPEFVPIDTPKTVPAAGKVQKKAPFAFPSGAEMAIIYRTMLKHADEVSADPQLLEKCEKEWFYAGHRELQIATRLTFVKNYTEEWQETVKTHRYADRHKPYVYKELAEQEMQVVREAILRNRKQGDHYNTIIEKCLQQWESEIEQMLAEAGPPAEEQLHALTSQLFELILDRSPTAEEKQHFASLFITYSTKLGRGPAVEKLIQTLMLNSEFAYRYEFGVGEPDTHGRRMLSARDASYAIAYALTDSAPDEELAKAATQGRLNTREDYEREVRRMLAERDQYYLIDEAIKADRGPGPASLTNMPIRELRFFREFFGYPKMMQIFKDDKRFGGHYRASRHRLLAEADRLVEHILEQDENVFEQLLTTDQFYVFHSGNNEAMQASSERIQKIYDYFKDKNWREFTHEDLVAHQDFIESVKMRGVNPANAKSLGPFLTQMESFSLRLGKGQSAAAPYNSFPAHGMANATSRTGTRLRSPQVAMFWNIDMTDWDYSPVQPTPMPHRKGILTHPAWLIAYAQNQESDPIHRGKWIQEKLLAGTIPDVPITVDAVVPKNPHKTLRQRLIAKTNNEYCWTCHQKMEPLGLPFEIFDDFGRYRTEEQLEYPENLLAKGKDKGAPHEDLRDRYKTLPVDAAGRLEGTGDSALDGDVEDAFDLIDRLAKSDRVRQSVIRHAFRYFMGRNEMLSDSQTLINAERAYLDSDGSFDEVIVSLLTSDSFIYRKVPENED